MALTKVTSNVIADDAITSAMIAPGAIDDTHITGITTTDIAEGTNQYYTDGKVGTYLNVNGYDTATNIISAITDTAPITLDTLNELAAALGDDPNFATTVTNSIATKLPLAGGTMTGTLAMGANAITSTGTISSGAITSTGDIDTAGLLKVGGNDSEYANNYIRFKPTGAAYIDHSTVGQDINFRTSASSSLDRTPLVVQSGGILVTGSVNVSSNVIQANGNQHVIGVWGTSGLQLIGQTGADNTVGTMGANEPLVFRTGSTERARIDASGNLMVGAGSTSTRAVLTPDAVFQSYYSTESAARIHLGRDVGIGGGAGVAFGGGGGYALIGTDNTSGTNLYFNAGSNAVGSLTTGHQMWINGSTNQIGIGTIQTGGALNVNDSIYVSETNTPRIRLRNIGNSDTELGVNGLGAGLDTFYISQYAGIAANEWDFRITGASREFAFARGGVINEGGASSDFRVESDDSTNMFQVSAGSNTVDIGASGGYISSHLAIQNPRDRHHFAMTSSPNSQISATGGAMYAEGVVSISNVSAGTVLSIPHFSQGNLWRPTYVELMFVTGEYNSSTGKAGYAKVSYSMLTFLANVTTLAVGGNVASVTTSGMNLLINFTGGYSSGLNDYEGVQMHYKIMSRTPDYFQAWNATLN